MALGLRSSAHMARANNRHLARAGVISDALQSVGGTTPAGTPAAVTPPAPPTDSSKSSSSPPATPSTPNTTPKTPSTPTTPTTPTTTKPSPSASNPPSDSLSNTKSLTTSPSSSPTPPAAGGAQTINNAPGTIGGAATIAGAGVGGVTSTPVTAPSFALPATSSTSASAKSSGIPTTTIIVIAAGGIIGIAIAIAAVSFILRRCRSKRHDDALGEAFDRSEFKRNSVMVGDEALSERSRPRPPTMIDRHLNRPAASSQGHGGYSAYDHQAQQQQQQQGYYPQQPAYPDYPDYGQQHGQQFQGGGYYQGEVLPPSMSQYDSPAQSPIGDHFSEHHATGPQYVNHQVNFAGAGAGAAGRSLTRHMSDDSTLVADLGRGHSVTPFQAVQYAEISRRLTDGSDGPTDAAQAYARLDRQATSGQHGRAPVHPAAYDHAQYHGRPASQYDAEDAYGGI